MPIAITISRLYNGVMAYYSPENPYPVSALDGYHDGVLPSGSRRPSSAAKIVLALQACVGYTVGIQTPQGESLFPTSATSLPQVFMAFLKRESGIVIYPPENPPRRL